MGEKTGLDKCRNLYCDTKMHMVEKITRDQSYSVAILTISYC